MTAGQNTMIFKTCRGASMQHVLQYIMANHCWIWKKVILQIMRLHSKAILSRLYRNGLCAGYWTFDAIACIYCTYFLANAKVTKNSNRSKSIDPLNSQLLFWEMCSLMLVQEIGHLVISCSIIDFCNKLQWAFDNFIMDSWTSIWAPIIYFFDGRSPSRYKQIFFIQHIPSCNNSLKEMLR